MNLGIWVVLIEWIGDWKTFIKTWKYDIFVFVSERTNKRHHHHQGPLYPFAKHLTGADRTVTTVRIRKLSVIQNKECFGCITCKRIFNSDWLLNRHERNTLLGAGIQPDFISTFTQNQYKVALDKADKPEEALPIKIYEFMSCNVVYNMRPGILWYDNNQDLKFNLHGKMN